MSKEALILLLLVAGAAVGIVYVIRQASSNQADWDEYEKVRLGDSYASVKARFGTVSEDLHTLGDARGAGYASAFKEALEAGGTRMFIVPTRDDSFMFGFDKDDKLIYKNFRRP
jgi:hypothetical protein